MSLNTMRAVVFHPSERRLRLEIRPIPQVGNDEVLVRVGATGICGSDLHVVAGTSPEPMGENPVLGHETMGVVAAAGRNVAGLSPGQRVGVEPLIGCGSCVRCRTGMYHLCDRLELIGMERSGGFAEYLVAPADKVFPLPDEVTDEEAAVLDCVAVAVHVLNRARLAPGSTVLVLGGGTIGNMIAQLARAWGAGLVGISDLSELRLSIAREVGIPFTFKANASDFAAQVRRAMGEVDFAIEAVGGRVPTINQALQVVRPGGRISFMGIFSQDMPINLWDVLRKEVSIVPAWSYAYAGQRREFEVAVKTLAERRIDVRSLITHRFGLDQIEQAFTQAQDSASALKVIVKP